MEFILNKELHSFRFRSYNFLPNIPVDVREDNDICDLLNSTKVKPVENVIIKKSITPFFEKQPKEGQLKIGALRVGGIGDTLQLGAHARAIKRKFPNCFLTVYVRDKINAEVMESNKYVDKIFQVGVASWDSIVALHSQSQDIFYDFRYAVKVIFNTDKFSEYKVNTEKVFKEYENIYKDFCKSNYKIEKFGMNLIDFSNIVACLEGDENDMSFDLREDCCNYARVLDKQKYITIHISAGKFRVTKSWDINRWVEIAEFLLEKGYTVVQVGDKGEPWIKGALDLRGLASIQETAWLLHGAQFHVDTEGGLVHLAKAVNTPSIVIFGATPVECFGYKGNINLRTTECPPCWYKTKDWYDKCPDGFDEKCLKLITVDMVKGAINEFDNKYKEKRVVSESTGNSLVSIIIPVLNQLNYLLIAVNSILSNTKQDFELIIVDNGSDKEVKEYLNTLKQSKMVRIIINEKNLGFSKANNQGAKEAIGKYLCFLNSDIKVGDNWLGNLLAGFDDNRIGMVGVSGGRLDRECRCTGLTGNNNDRYDYLEGWCLLIPKKIFDNLKGFDEDFSPAFSEDADLSLRLRKGGFRTKIVSGVAIQHYGNKTVYSQTDFDVTKISYKNSLRLKQKLKTI